MAAANFSMPDADEHAPLEDRDAACPSWAAAGECDRNPGFMDVSCALSCKRHHDAADTPPEPAPQFEWPQLSPPVFWALVCVVLAVVYTALQRRRRHAAPPAAPSRSAAEEAALRERRLRRIDSAPSVACLLYTSPSPRDRG